MKTVKFRLGILFLIVPLCLISYNAYSQEKRLTRQERMEKMIADLNANYRQLGKLLEMRKFVFEMDYAYGTGWGKNVDPTVFFIKVDSSFVIIQPSGISEYYVVGAGDHAKGSVKNWNLIKDVDALSYKLEFIAVTKIQDYHISMNISAENSVRATITGPKSGIRFYLGNIQIINYPGIPPTP